MDTNFRTYLDKSNFQISALVIRSLIYDEEKYKLLIDTNRLKDELIFYKEIVKLQKPSIISALYPLIYGNKSVYNAYEEAVRLFTLIRHKIAGNEQYAIYLLSLIIKNKKVQKEDIIQYNIESLGKEEAIKLQKAKVDSIIGFDKILNLIFKWLNEDIDYMQIFESSDLDCLSIDGYKDKIETYFENIVHGKVQARRYESRNMEKLKNVFRQNVGYEISCSLIPRGIISKIEKSDSNIIVTIETPNTEYQLIKELGKGNNEL